MEVEGPRARDLVLVATFAAAAVGMAASDWTVLAALANVLHLVSRVSRPRFAVVTLDGEVVFDGFVRAVKAADRDQGDHDWMDVDLAAAKEVDCVADALHIRLKRFPNLHLHIG